MRVEPLHQLFTHRGIIETSLRKVKDNKERETGVQCPVVVSIVLKGLRSVQRFLERRSADYRSNRGDTHRRLRPAIHDKFDIIYGVPDQHLRNLLAAPPGTAILAGD